MERTRTRRVYIGNVPVGGGAPIAVQSMTTTDTRDVEATVAQIHALEAAGCEIVRVAVPDRQAAEALRQIKQRIHIPLVADIHFDYRLALAALEAGVDKLRLNPGNIGSADRVRAVAREARARGVPIRVAPTSARCPRRCCASTASPAPTPWWRAPSTRSGSSRTWTSTTSSCPSRRATWRWPSRPT